VSGQLHAPITYPLEKNPGIHWIGVWVHSRAGLDDVEKRKFLTLPESNSDPANVQPIASRYTDYAILAPVKVVYLMQNVFNHLNMFNILDLHSSRSLSSCCNFLCSLSAEMLQALPMTVPAQLNN
jgi:hypothetical protein